MNKQEIKELVDLFALTSDTAKSAVNRLEASLSKTGSASSRLSMVGSSLLKLAEQVNEEDAPTLEAVGQMAKFFSLVAVDNKKAQAEATPKKSRKTGWEGLKDADEAPAKPRKAKAGQFDEIKTEAHEQMERLIAILNQVSELEARR